MRGAFKIRWNGYTMSGSVKEINSNSNGMEYTISGSVREIYSKLNGMKYTISGGVREIC